ncbi:LA2681 family HEPN domain-containing protein [Methylophaga thalassica]|uniref:LA2681 family HEPN domain-containing protein n=1 Tax=Methylophaga aminisulfidivorans TaxID=230105 RepID=UPI0024E232B8|nr:LA2681 family HEPN domain-containing protein [Methylophaga aminisulfidivorans]
MVEKIQITIDEHNKYCAQMDDLCDKSDFNGIVSLCQSLEKSTHSSAIIRMHIYYNIASGYSHVGARRDNTFDSVTSGLASLNFRKALAEAKAVERDQFNDIYTESELFAFADLKSRLQTNFANELDHQGRRLESLAIYNEPIRAGNVYAVLGKARCLYHLAESVYDDGHAFHLYRESAKHYQEALSRVEEFDPVHREAIRNDEFHNQFLSWFSIKEEQIGAEIPELENLPGSDFKTRKEKDYFAWCAEQRLFINELNSISIASVVDHDVLNLPGFTTRMNPLLTHSEELSFHGHFNEMKTDYCYARYLAYMGCSIPLFEEHFFNSTFEQVDTLDYQVDNLKAHHLKSCFRISYSIFDKVAFFLHRFFQLDATKNDHQVDFKKIWFKPGNQSLKAMFQNSDNSHFRALYFLSREIRQAGRDVPEDRDPSYWFDPDTERLFKIRNFIEHRSFKLVDGVCYRITESFPSSLGSVDEYKMELSEKTNELARMIKIKGSQHSDPDLDTRIRKLEERIEQLNNNLDEKARMSSYSLTVGIEEFERLTIKLLTLAKDALIYLSLGIHHEERKKASIGLTIPRYVPKK